MKIFSHLSIAAPALPLALALAAAPADAAEWPRAPLASPSAPGFPLADAGSLPLREVAEHRRGKRGRIYDDRGRYFEPRRLGRNDRVWRDDRGRWRCRRDNGTTGLIIGAGAGALLGRTIDTQGDRTLGTVLGAAGGGLLGRELDRGYIRCR